MALRTVIMLSLLLFLHGAMLAKAYPEEDEGNVQETGWIDISADSEQEDPTDSEPMEQELRLNLEDAKLEELPADEFDAEGTNDDTMERDSTEMFDVCRQGVPFLERTANNARFPDIRRGRFSITGLDISDTNINSCSVTGNGNRKTVELSQMTTQLFGRYRYKRGWFRIRGNVTIRITGARMRMLFSHRLGADQCPIISDVQCSASIRRVQVKFRGQWLRFAVLGGRFCSFVGQKSFGGCLPHETYSAGYAGPHAACFKYTIVSELERTQI